MRATKAYIAGLGTTGILITCFTLLLTVGSALVAFQGWPGAAAGGGLERVVVKNRAERDTAQSRQHRTTRRPGPAGARRAERATGRSVRDGRQVSLQRPALPRTGGLAPAMDDRPGSGQAGGRPGPAAGAPANTGGGSRRTQEPAPAPDVGNTVEQTTGGVSDAVQGTTGGLGDAAQGAADGLGDAVGGVSPGLGETVSGSGEAAGQVVDGAGQGVGQVVEDTGRTVNGLLP
jgi:hypothetical protein